MMLGGKVKLILNITTYHQGGRGLPQKSLKIDHVFIGRLPNILLMILLMILLGRTNQAPFGRKETQINSKSIITIIKFMQDFS